ncbi:SDR family oxidoreductase [Traorella massiliensis]|uniref:SDR family NAD(P)-dependent oxidoreductase n=1 Tax=Traorella massiliensis TaxID=1903263 RepID=UPI00248EA130|nr:SDR family oxidoreductase [Traorella massiliensis]
MKLDGKVAIVTGGGSGIGKAIAVRYAKEGAHVVIVGRREAVLKETAALDDKISYVAGDITKDEVVEHVMETVKEKYGHLDILINNAGWCPVQPITEITIEDYDKAFSLDVRALVNMTIHALPMIIEAKGNIINLFMYQAAKIAVENFTRVWAIELAEKGVRVNAIAPGAIRTDIWNVTNLSLEDAKKHEEGIASSIPFKRFGKPDEVANVALFLASDEASYVSGSVYAVDGAQGTA